MVVSLWRMALRHLAATGHSHDDRLAHQNPAAGVPHTPEINDFVRRTTGRLGERGRLCIEPRRLDSQRSGSTVVASHMNEEPIKRFTLLVLLQAQQDHATELTIGPASRGRPPIRYKVRGTWYDMSPPPAQIMPDVVAELGRLAGFTHRPFPREGLIDVLCGSVRLRWVIRVTSADADCVLTPIEQ